MGMQPLFHFNVKASAAPALLTLGRARGTRGRGRYRVLTLSGTHADRIEFVGTDTRGRSQTPAALPDFPPPQPSPCQPLLCRPSLSVLVSLFHLTPLPPCGLRSAPAVSIHRLFHPHSLDPEGVARF